MKCNVIQRISKIFLTLTMAEDCDDFLIGERTIAIHVSFVQQGPKFGHLLFRFPKRIFSLLHVGHGSDGLHQRTAEHTHHLGCSRRAKNK